MDLTKLLKTQWDRAGAIGFSVIGAICLLFGWIGVSGTAYIAEQAPYIVSGAVGGLFFLGLGSTLWLSADLRDEWRKLDRIEEALHEGTLRWVEAGEPDSRAVGSISAAVAARPVSSEETTQLAPILIAASNGSPTKKSASANGSRGKKATTATTQHRVSPARGLAKTSGVVSDA